MKTPTLKISVYRILVAVIAGFLFVLTLVTFFSFASSPTDENVFRDLDARLVVVRTVPAQQISRVPFDGLQIMRESVRYDSIMVGDLIFGINGRNAKTVKDAVDAIYSGPGDEVSIDVLRPSANFRINYRVRRSIIEQNFLALLPQYVFVSNITPGGASDRAGMKVGDLILRINNLEFSTAQEADRILREGQIGKSLTYVVMRDTKYVELNVVLAKFGVVIAVLIFSVSGFVIMLIGFFIVFSRPNIFSARLIGTGFLLIGFAMSVAVIRRGFDGTAIEYIRNIIMVLGLSYGLAMLTHANHFFPIERPELSSRRWIVVTHYCLATIMAFVVSVANFVPIIALLPLFWLFVYFRFRKSATAEYKQLNFIIRWTGIVVGILSTIIIILFNAKVGLVGFGIFGLLLTAIPFSYLYTIGRYRLLDINFRVRRNTQYTFVTALWSVLLVYGFIWILFELPQVDLPKVNIVFTGASIEVNDAPELAGQRVSSEGILLIGLALVVTFVAVRVRRAGQRMIDKKYFRMQYDYRKAQEELGELLATTLSMEELAKGFVKKLSELVRLKSAGVIFFRDEKCCTCEEAYGFDGTEWRSFCIMHETLLITAVKQFQNEIRIQYLPSPIKEEFQKEGFQYLIPVRSKDKLIGVILVGEKWAETTFQQEDLSFLTSTSKQASVAIENAFLYEQLAERERMKHELEIARRIQLDSLPQSTPVVQGLDISGSSRPAMEVGGDFYDYLQNGNKKITVVVGDVSGKGTSAALYMSKIQGILRSLHGFDLEPLALFSKANKLLCRDLEKRSFVTVLGAEFDTIKKEIIVARAGHLPLWHYRSGSRSVDKIIPRGLGLGLNDAEVFASEMEQKVVPYASGDIFLFATDGVTDANDSHKDFGEEALPLLLIDHADKTAAQIHQIILDSVRKHVGDHSQYDDETIVLVKAL